MSDIALPTMPDLWEAGIITPNFLIEAKNSVTSPGGSYTESQIPCIALIVMCCELIKEHPAWYRAYTTMVTIPARNKLGMLAWTSVHRYWMNAGNDWKFSDPLVFPIAIPGMQDKGTTYTKLQAALEQFLEKLLALGDPE